MWIICFFWSSCLFYYSHIDEMATCSVFHPVFALYDNWERLRLTPPRPWAQEQVGLEDGWTARRINALQFPSMVLHDEWVRWTERDYGNNLSGVQTYDRTTSSLVEMEKLLSFWVLRENPTHCGHYFTTFGHFPSNDCQEEMVIVASSLKAIWSAHTNTNTQTYKKIMCR